jgi:hypothetical protein
MHETIVELQNKHACHESGDSKIVTNELELQNKKLEEAKRAAEKLAEELNTQMTILKDQLSLANSKKA